MMKKILAVLSVLAFATPVLAYDASSNFDPAGAAAAVQSYITGQMGYLSSNGTAITASTTIPASSLSGTLSVSQLPSFIPAVSASSLMTSFGGL